VNLNLKFSLEGVDSGRGSEVFKGNEELWGRKSDSYGEC